MLISDSHKFIFLRMRKVASRSMRAVLQPLCIPRPPGRLQHVLSRARLVWDYHDYVFRAHESILAAKRRMPEENFNNYFKFAFVRNPWERLVSEYEFILRNPSPVTIDLIDLQGRVVGDLYRSVDLPAGHHEATISIPTTATGTYILRMTSRSGAASMAIQIIP